MLQVRVVSFTAFGPCGLLFELRRMDGEGRSIRMRPSQLEFGTCNLAMRKHLSEKEHSSYLSTLFNKKGTFSVAVLLSVV